MLSLLKNDISIESTEAGLECRVVQALKGLKNTISSSGTFSAIALLICVNDIVSDCLTYHMPAKHFNKRTYTVIGKFATSGWTRRAHRHRGGTGGRAVGRRELWRLAYGLHLGTQLRTKRLRWRYTLQRVINRYSSRCSIPTRQEISLTNLDP